MTANMAGEKAGSQDENIKAQLESFERTLKIKAKLPDVSLQNRVRLLLHHIEAPPTIFDDSQELQWLFLCQKMERDFPSQSPNKPNIDEPLPMVRIEDHAYFGQVVKVNGTVLFQRESAKKSFFIRLCKQLHVPNTNRRIPIQRSMKRVIEHVKNINRDFREKIPEASDPLIRREGSTLIACFDLNPENHSLQS
ncbi:MAG: hypothetical protein AB7P76_07505 [Candidatus Melainabacteria bacterium]